MELFADYQLLTTKELAKLTGLGRDKAYMLMQDRSFPSIKIGKTYRVAYKEYKLWIERNRGRHIDLQ